MYKLALLFLIIAATIIGGFFAYDGPRSRIETTDIVTPPQSITGNPHVTIEEYVRTNISRLSPIKESLGGTFHVTEIEVEPEESKGTVQYEDGHMAYEAEFTYLINERSEYSVTSFVIRDY